MFEPDLVSGFFMPNLKYRNEWFKSLSLVFKRKYSRLKGEIIDEIWFYSVL